MQSIDKNSLQRLSSRSDEDKLNSGLREMANMFKPVLGKKNKKTDLVSKKHLVGKMATSKIIPANHFKSNCPPEALEKALMLDLERHMTLEDIISYRQEVHNQLDSEEFRRKIDEEAAKNSAFTNIFNYFMKKGGVEILVQTKRISFVGLKLVTGKIRISIEKTDRCYDPETINPFLELEISGFELKGSIESSEPRINVQESEYERNTLFNINIGKIQLIDLLDPKVPQKILLIDIGTNLDLDNCFKKEIDDKNIVIKEETKLKTFIPSLLIVLRPELTNNFIEFSSGLKTGHNLKYKKEEYFLGLMECFQTIHLKTSTSPNVKYNLDIKIVTVVLPQKYLDEPSLAAKLEIGNSNLAGDCEKFKIDMKYIDLQLGTFDPGQTQRISGVSVFKTQGMIVDYIKEPSIRRIEQQLPSLRKLKIKDIYEEPIDIKITGGIIDINLKLDNLYELSQIVAE